MKIAVVTPTLGDRQQFMVVLEKMIQSQTIQPDIHIIVDDEHYVQYPDVTWRYKQAFTRAFEAGADIVLPMEDDDWYASDYIEQMCNKWIEHGKPHMLGIDHTIYYHLRLRRYAYLKHPGRASTMSMLITKELEIAWCEESYPFIDYYMWTKMPCRSKVAFPMDRNISIGIKHGIGKVAGGGHRSNIGIYSSPSVGQDDSTLEFLSSHVTAEQLRFYINCIK